MGNLGKKYPTYMVSADFLPQAEYKTEHVKLHDENTRTLYDVHGLKITTLVQGKHYEWDINSKLIGAILTMFITSWIAYDKVFERFLRPFIWNYLKVRGY